MVLDSIREYLGKEPLSVSGKEITENDIQDKTIFIDDYTGDGYGANSAEIQDTIKESLVKYGMPLDSTYTGKAFLGMKKYIRQKGIADKNILFIHTGGTPLFFDDLNKMRR